MDIELGVSFDSGNEMTTTFRYVQIPSRNVKVFISNLTKVLNYITDKFKCLTTVDFNIHNNNEGDKDTLEFCDLMRSL